MLSNGKYIVLGEQHILIFDPALGHDEVAHRFAQGTVTSAGFIDVGVGIREYDAEKVPMVSCYGRSTSLKIDSNPTIDEALAKFALGLDY